MNRVADKNALTLYSSVGCHLCEEARAMLQHLIAKHQLNAAINEVDVLINETIEAEYAARIPVVLVETQEIGYPFDLAVLENWLLAVLENRACEGVHG